MMSPLQQCSALVVAARSLGNGAAISPGGKASVVDDASPAARAREQGPEETSRTRSGHGNTAAMPHGPAARTQAPQTQRAKRADTAGRRQARGSGAAAAAAELARAGQQEGLEARARHVLAAAEAAHGDAEGAWEISAGGLGDVPEAAVAHLGLHRILHVLRPGEKASCNDATSITPMRRR